MTAPILSDASTSPDEFFDRDDELASPAEGGTGSFKTNFCISCRESLPFGARFCPICGNSVNPNAQSVATQRGDELGASHPFSGRVNKANSYDYQTQNTSGAPSERSGKILRIARERPSLAITTTIALLTLIFGIVAVTWINATSTVNRNQIGSETATGKFYAARVAHIRNAPTASAPVVADLAAEQSVVGDWIFGSDGITKWLRIKMNNGSYAFVWGGNLSQDPTSKPISGRTGNIGPLAQATENNSTAESAFHNDYLQSQLKLASYRNALSRIFSNRTDVSKWVHDQYVIGAGAVERPGKLVTITGSTYEFYQGCKPHECPGNFMYLLFSRGGNQAWALSTEDSANYRFYGSPSMDKQEFLLSQVKE